MGVRKYKPNDWRIFIDSSTRRLKCVLLHNGNRYVSLPIAHSTKLKEEYDNIKLLLQKIKYDEHRWPICVDLKIVTFCLVSKAGTLSIHVFYAYGQSSTPTALEKNSMANKEIHGSWRS